MRQELVMHLTKMSYVCRVSSTGAQLRVLDERVGIDRPTHNLQSQLEHHTNNYTNTPTCVEEDRHTQLWVKLHCACDV